jgi:mevalonate pyrophosphate decarboxylase
VKVSEQPLRQKLVGKYDQAIRISWIFCFAFCLMKFRKCLRLDLNPNKNHIYYNEKVYVGVMEQKNVVIQ